MAARQHRDPAAHLEARGLGQRERHPGERLDRRPVDVLRQPQRVDPGRLEQPDRRLELAGNPGRPERNPDPDSHARQFPPTRLRGAAGPRRPGRSATPMIASMSIPCVAASPGAFQGSTTGRRRPRPARMPSRSAPSSASRDAICPAVTLEAVARPAASAISGSAATLSCRMAIVLACRRAVAQAPAEAARITVTPSGAVRTSSSVWPMTGSAMPGRRGRPPGGLAAEHRVDGIGRDLGGIGDLAHCRQGVPVLREQLLRRAEYRVASQHGGPFPDDRAVGANRHRPILGD